MAEASENKILGLYSKAVNKRHLFFLGGGGAAAVLSQQLVALIYFLLSHSLEHGGMCLPSLKDPSLTLTAQ